MSISVTPSTTNRPHHPRHPGGPQGRRHHRRRSLRRCHGQSGPGGRRCHRGQRIRAAGQAILRSAGYQLQQADERGILFPGGDFEEVQADEEFQEYAGEEFGEKEKVIWTP